MYSKKPYHKSIAVSVQAGYLTAVGIFALENHINRLALDHLHAKQIAEALSKKDFTGEVMPIETNIIIFEVKGKYTAKSLVEEFKKNNILKSISYHIYFTGFCFLLSCMMGTAKKQR